jgi:hypothetical protein
MPVTAPAAQIDRGTRERAADRKRLEQAADDVGESLADQFLVGVDALLVRVAIAFAMEIASMKPTSDDHERAR